MYPSHHKFSEPEVVTFVEHAGLHLLENIALTLLWTAHFIDYHTKDFESRMYISITQRLEKRFGFQRL